jgi:hypothetical protein
MAAPIISLYRNYDSSDTTFLKETPSPASGLPDPATLGWAKEGCVFKEWNTSRDGSGISFDIGAYTERNVYAIWEESSGSKLIVTKSELEAIADAIRAKTGQSGDLTYPNGFVSAINSI